MGAAKVYLEDHAWSSFFLLVCFDRIVFFFGQVEAKLCQLDHRLGDVDDPIILAGELGSQRLQLLLPSFTIRALDLEAWIGAADDQNIFGLSCIEIQILGQIVDRGCRGLLLADGQLAVLRFDDLKFVAFFLHLIIFIINILNFEVALVRS